MTILEIYDPSVLAFVNNPTAWIIILVVIFLFFGGKNIPEMMKGLGQGMREFKKGLEQDDEEPTRSSAVDQDQEARIRAQVEDEVRRRVDMERQRRRETLGSATDEREDRLRQ
jgi:sec-independent protein translocase protein TatA